MSDDQIDKIWKKLEELKIELVGVKNAVNLHDVYMNQGFKWRIALCGVVLSLVLQVVGFSYFYGILTQTVANHEKQIDFILRK